MALSSNSVQELLTKAGNLSETDPERALEILDRLANWLDSAITIPGTNFKIGFDSLIGLIPGIGDAASAIISSWIVIQAKNMGVSKWTLTRMITNVGVDAVVGAVPLVGDVFDASFKANKKNIALLKKHMEKQKAQGTSPKSKATPNASPQGPRTLDWSLKSKPKPASA